MKQKDKPLIGFIGQGWIGKNYADDFEEREYTVIRYALEEPYLQNKDKIKDCDIVFIAVPTPTTTEGFDDSVIRKVIPLVGKGKVAVIKSTILPGTTESIQKDNQDIFVVHSPEFLTEASAAHDAANPASNIVGIPQMDEKNQEVGRRVLDVLPPALFEQVCHAYEAELIKYTANCFKFTKVIFMNLAYDLTKAFGGDWEIIRKALLADPMVGNWHLKPVHKKGRGAGGHCFIKDFAAFTELYKERMPFDKRAHAFLDSAIEKNIELLLTSKKDLDLLEGVHGNLDGLKEDYDQADQEKALL